MNGLRVKQRGRERVKTVLLNSLSIDLFKGVTSCKLCFDSSSAAVYGANGTGKSTIADAWTWLLFGKNSAGASDFSVKPLDESGAVRDHDAHTSVTAEISVDGEAHTLRRVYYEKWSHKRGAAQASFDGHTTDFYIDGVPRSKSEYDAAISTLIAPEDVFMLLSRLNAFCEGLTWQKRRQMLFSLAEIGSDIEIMQTDVRFSSLADAVGSVTLDELRRRLTSENKRYSDELIALSGRIEEAASMAREIHTHEAEVTFRLASEHQAEAACELTELIEKRESLRAQYTAFADAPLSTGNAVCPTCGQTLDEAARRTAAERARQTQLQAIADEGKRLNERIELAERTLAKHEAALSAAQIELERAKISDASEGDTVAAKRLEELNVTQEKSALNNAKIIVYCFLQMNLCAIRYRLSRTA